MKHLCGSGWHLPRTILAVCKQQIVWPQFFRRGSRSACWLNMRLPANFLVTRGCCMCHYKPCRPPQGRIWPRHISCHTDPTTAAVNTKPTKPNPKLPAQSFKHEARNPKPQGFYQARAPKPWEIRAVLWAPAQVLGVLPLRPVAESREAVFPERVSVKGSSS